MPAPIVVDHGFFSRIDTEAKAYWLGFLAADGCVSDRNKISLQIGAKDAGHLATFRSHVGSLHQLRAGAVSGAGYKPGTGWAAICFRSTQMAADLARHGVVQRKSLTAEPWVGPPYLMRHYFRGLVDGDGWLTWCRTTRAWSVGLIGSRLVVGAFARFAQVACGSEVVPTPKKTAWRVEIGGSFKPIALTKALYDGATVSLPRKAELAARLMSHQPRHPAPHFDWSAVTRDELEERHGRLRTWKAVAAEMGCSLGSLIQLKSRYFGLTDYRMPPR